MADQRVVIRRIGPASAFKVALGISVVGLIAWLLAVALIYFGANAVGLWDRMNSIIGGAGGQEVISFPLVMSLAALFGAVVALLNCALAPLLALIYNGLADIFGGLRVTLS